MLNLVVYSVGACWCSKLGYDTSSRYLTLAGKCPIMYYLAAGLLYIVPGGPQVNQLLRHSPFLSFRVCLYADRSYIRKTMRGVQVNQLMVPFTLPDCHLACMQAATAVSTRTSLESSGSNHTAATHAAEHDASSQSQQADWPHAFTSTAAPPSSGAWQQHMQPATGTEDCKQLEVS